MRIALIEDNAPLADAIKNSLQDHGLGVDHLANGLDGEAFLAQSRVDVAIIDVNLPGLDGLSIVRAMRRSGNATPVLILTAMGKTSERVTGLEAGADDYLVKPFEMAELIARLRALARRRPMLQAREESVGSLSFDREARVLSGPAGPIDLPRREMALFACLLENRGRIVAREHISDTLYGTGTEVEPNAIELLVSRLRRKLGDTGVAIRTARGLGYMLDEDNA
ncbi:response regulator transcription factor [Gemmobacter sp. LW-1]|uniref:response regulator transcription factor n=1 Tax=Gemmobacter sp. LW-1 TaxID=1529005 RepID=UPI0006C75A32|nr:response regulator transcription factor [Gemmobacter sp. LW-1]